MAREHQLIQYATPLNSVPSYIQLENQETVCLASRCFQSLHCASTVEEFWHKAIVRGPTYTSTLILSHSFTACLSLSLIHSISMFLSIIGRSQSLVFSLSDCFILSLLIPFPSSLYHWLYPLVSCSVSSLVFFVSKASIKTHQ